jgi:hypothetical protein
VAPALGVRPVDDADEAFQPWTAEQPTAQLLGGFLLAAAFRRAQIQQETRQPRVVAQALHAVGQRRANWLEKIKNYF